MSITIDCGEGKHDLCIGTGRSAYMFPQEDRFPPDPPFYCGCQCHHEGVKGRDGERIFGTPCAECAAVEAGQEKAP